MRGSDSGSDGGSGGVPLSDMDTCILIPDELSVVLRPGPSVQNGGLMEMGATIWANQALYPGQSFRPDQGKIRLEKLEIYTSLKSTDVRNEFGVVDQILDVEEAEVRHCNWVRFIQSANSIDDVNIVGIRVGGRPLFQVIKVIPVNSELKAYFSRQEQEVEPEPEVEVDIVNVKQEVEPAANERPVSPEPASPARSHVGLSPWKSPISPRSSRSLVTSPSDDDAKSTTSDVTVASLDSPHSSKSPNRSFATDSRAQIGLTPTIHSSPTHMLPHSRLLSQTMPSLPSSLGASPIGHGTPHGTPMGVGVALARSPPGLHLFRSPPPGDLHGKGGSPGRGTGAEMGDGVGTPEKLSSTSVAPVRRNRERTWLPCEVCGKKFDRPSLLRRHMRTHTGEKPHACNVCGKAFSTSSSLNTHRRIHSGEKPHQCQICGKRFTASSNLYYHRMTHNKEKPHKCTLCSKSFPTPGDLKSHMYVHNGSWPYKCHICNRGFSKQTNLKNHLLLHTGERPHDCPLCGKKFALQCNLKTHFKTHEGEAQEECYKCGTVSLVSSGQIINGYCRGCLSRSYPTNSPHVPPPPPGIARPRPASFTIENLATPANNSSNNNSNNAQGSPPNQQRTPPQSSAIPPSIGHNRQLAMSGYAMLSPPPANMAANMAAQPLPVRMPPAGSGLLHYPGALTWPKLVSQQY